MVTIEKAVGGSGVMSAESKRLVQRFYEEVLHRQQLPTGTLAAERGALPPEPMRRDRTASHREAYFQAKAAHAEQEADAALSGELTASWQRVAETYRWLAYSQLAFGKWQPPRPAKDVVTAVGGDLSTC